MQSESFFTFCFSSPNKHTVYQEIKRLRTAIFHKKNHPSKPTFVKILNVRYTQKWSPQNALTLPAFFFLLLSNPWLSSKLIHNTWCHGSRFSRAKRRRDLVKLHIHKPICLLEPRRKTRPVAKKGTPGGIKLEGAHNKKKSLTIIKTQFIYESRKKLMFAKEDRSGKLQHGSQLYVVCV